MKDQVINIVVAGLGGQGVIKASDILADVAFRAGLDVKKAEIHGMSQRGGSVSTDVRFGHNILSPMIPPGQADYLIVLASDQVENNRWTVKTTGIVITPADIEGVELSNRKSANVAMLGVLSQHLDFPESLWHESLRAHLPERLLAANVQAFAAGRNALVSTGGAS